MPICRLSAAEALSHNPLDEIVAVLVHEAVACRDFEQQVGGAAAPGPSVYDKLETIILAFI
jgi:hypothetical protein